MIELQDSDAELLQRQLQREDDDLAHAVSLSLRVFIRHFLERKLVVCCLSIP